MIGGRVYLRTVDGGPLPRELGKPLDELKGGVVRHFLCHEIALSQQVNRFLGHAFNDVGNFERLITQDGNACLGGKTGNITLYRAGFIRPRFLVSARLALRMRCRPPMLWLTNV